MAPKPPQVDLNVYGKTGLIQFGGYVFEEYDPALQLDRGRKVWKEMRESDSVVGALLFAIEMLCRKVQWSWTPADTSTKAEMIAEHFDTSLDDMSMSFPDTMAEILSFLPYGFAPLESCYKIRGGPDGDDGRYQSKYDDGAISWRKWSIRSQDSLLRWEFDDDGGLKGMWQIPPPDYVVRFIPIEKMLLFRTTIRKSSPEGRSILRNAYRSWYLLNNIQNIEAIGIERDLAGLPVITVPWEWTLPTASPDEQTIYKSLKQIVTRIKRDEQEGLVLPQYFDPETKQPLIDLKLLATGGSRQIDASAVIQRYETRIAMTVLADFLFLGTGNVGSWALSSDKTNLFAVALGSWLDMIAGVINTHEVPRIMRYNGWPQAMQPLLVHGDLKEVDLGKLGTFLQQLSMTGAQLWPNDELLADLMDKADLPEPQVKSSDWIKTADVPGGKPDPEAEKQTPPGVSQPTTSASKPTTNGKSTLGVKGR